MKTRAITPFDPKAAAAVALLAALSYLAFPGHTYLRQDSQIYVAILEHLWDPGALARDPVAARHHVTFTIWDELALAGRRITGLDFEQVLAAEHLFHRALGILGVFLIASAAGLSARPALIVAGVYALGATILGPAVLTVEYEPKPRASAVPLVMLAVGCAAHSRYLASGVFGSLAFLYHPPTVYPFWLVFFAMDLWPTRPDVMKKRLYGLAPLATAAVVLFIFSRLQIGGAEPPAPFARIDPELEQLQRMRASYAWASAWVGDWIGHYLFVWAVSIVAFLRLRKQMPVSLQFFAAGLPLIGMLSLPAGYLLLDRWKWALMPKFQPMRALLFVSAFAIVLAMIAALRAASLRRIPEAILWGVFAFAAVIQPRVSTLLLPDLNDPLTRRRCGLALALAALAAVAGWLDARRAALSWPVWGAALALPFFLIPYYGKVVAAEPSIESPELRELCAWARSQTPRDAVFLFPDAGRGPHPGVFRSRALRAVYVDWKSGGQVNMIKEFGQQWWRRWQEAVAPGFKPEYLPKYRELGIRFIVVGPENRLADCRPAFENRQFVVYDLG